MVGYFLKSERLQRKKGRKEERKKGRKEERKEERKEGRKEGRKKGRKEERKKNLDVPARGRTPHSGSGVQHSNHFTILAYVPDEG